MEKYQKYLSFCEHYENSHNGEKTIFSFEEWSHLYDEVQKLTNKYFNVDNTGFGALCPNPHNAVSLIILESSSN